MTDLLTDYQDLLRRLREIPHTRVFRHNLATGEKTYFPQTKSIDEEAADAIEALLKEREERDDYIRKLHAIINDHNDSNALNDIDCRIGFPDD